MTSLICKTRFSPLSWTPTGNRAYNSWKQIKVGIHTLAGFEDKRQRILPAPTGTTTFHLLLISFDIRRLTPLSLLPLRFPWSGYWHFIEALNLTPNWSRCFGQIVKSRPPSSNNLTRARISSFSEETLAWDTEICRRWALISLEQELRGRSSFPRDEISQWESQCEAKEQERLDIVFTT